MTKRKDERRELLKEDEFLSFLERVARFIQQKPKKVAVWSIVAVVVLALFFGWLDYRKGVRDTQARALYEAEKILATSLDDDTSEFKFSSEAEKYQAALAALDKVIKVESGVVRQQALVHKIAVFTNLGRQDELEPIYRELASGDRGLGFIGVMGLGDLFYAQGNYKEALEKYRSLLGMDGIPKMKDLVGYKAAQCYRGLGDLTNARQELIDLIARYEGEEESAKPPIVQKAQDLLAELEKDSGKKNGDA